ncbi:hypothetical protein QLH51_12965 [Sphingomonas sp. 2R-10]|uniref:hypothetical protein n=1 Tax=Sphingomonas sp. 2R-10 TaxID=3045148 RepID=UPI000F767FF0|nr:hypothetical protein [Sphingomonas sp. 2R-10]MDJ0277709.1 hypothetical protein [Sphingomonas sp. 2R-10]
MDDVDPVFPALDDPTIVRAIGHFAALLLTMLHRNKLLDIGEVGDHLTMYACLTSESDPAAGGALAYWASIVKDTAEDMRTG